MSAVEPEDDLCGEVGFMFDNELPKTTRLFRFDKITVAVRLVDDDPGAVQSGHYVWPAAPALGSYLVQNWELMPHGTVLELGAGCGLAGLVARRLEGTIAVIFTDHDPGVLRLIRESLSSQEQEDSVAESGHGRIPMAEARCVPLSWGPIGSSERTALAEALACIASPTASTAESDDRHPAQSNRQESLIQVEDCGGTSEEAGQHELQADRPISHARDENNAGGVGASATTSSVAKSIRGLLSTPSAETGEVPCDSSSVSFDLIIASDVIYSVAVVAPLFETVNDLLAGDDAPMRAQFVATEGSKGRGRAPMFVMSQSFGYDRETEQALDAACWRHGLVREVIWDELSLVTQDGIECSHDQRADGKRQAQDRPGSMSGNRAGTKLQLFRRNPSPES